MSVAFTHSKIFPVLAGVLASLLMAAIYFGLMRLTMSWQFVWTTFVANWYLIAVIVLGFGVQVGLWLWYRQKKKHDGVVAVTSGVVSGTAMLACCAHHLVDFAPLVALTGVTGALAQYQQPLLMFSASITLLGITFMLWQIRRC